MHSPLSYTLLFVVLFFIVIEVGWLYRLMDTQVGARTGRTRIAVTVISVVVISGAVAVEAQGGPAVFIKSVFIVSCGVFDLTDTAVALCKLRKGGANDEVCYHKEDPDSQYY